MINVPHLLNITSKFNKMKMYTNSKSFMFKPLSQISVQIFYCEKYENPTPPSLNYLRILVKRGQICQT